MDHGLHTGTHILVLSMLQNVDMHVNLSLSQAYIAVFSCITNIRSMSVIIMCGILTLIFCKDGTNV